MTSDDEEKIIDQVLAGQVHRYGLLVERYQGPIYNLMYRHCRSREEAADLSQEVFLRAYEKLSSYRREQRFFSWLYTLAINRARDWQRARRRQDNHMEELRHQEPAGSTVSEPEKKVMELQSHQLLYRALEQLEPETREILLARYQNEMRIREVAGIFSLSESAVKMRISRALRTLHTMLEEHENGA